MKLIGTMLVTLAAAEISAFSAPPRDWVRITKNDISQTLAVNSDVKTYNDANGGLVVEGTINNYGCGKEQSSHFGVLLADSFDPKWNAIRYTIEFVSGFSSCWSILGDTKYGGNKDLGLQLGEFDIIEDALVVPGGGSFDGKNVRCDGDADNFLHGQHGDGYRGYLVVEQKRDMSAKSAGIGSGYSCTKRGTVIRYKDISVLYATSSGCYHPTTGFEVIKDKISACSGNIKSGGGVYGRDAAILCRSGYEVCESAAYAAKLGLSEEICHDPSIFTNDKQFFATKETGSGYGRCYSGQNSEYIPGQNDANDIWGCGHPNAPSTLGVRTSYPCKVDGQTVMGYMIGSAGKSSYGDWKYGGDSYNEATTMSLVDARSGGVLCCKL